MNNKHCIIEILQGPKKHYILFYVSYQFQNITIIRKYFVKKEKVINHSLSFHIAVKSNIQLYFQDLFYYFTLQSDKFKERYCKADGSSVHLKRWNVSENVRPYKHFSLVCSLKYARVDRGLTKILIRNGNATAQKMKFPITNFFSKYKQIRSFLSAVFTV